MKVLIIGDSLSIQGGVPNYTRPLFEKLKRTVDVNYLFAGSYLGNYSLGASPKIVKNDENVFELINASLLSKNYNDLNLEVNEEKTNILLSEFLQGEKITHVHFHSMLGFPISTYKIIKDLKIKLYVTVHEYWWLCPHRVMVDFNRKICEGPSDIHKCSYCVHLQRHNQPKSSYTKFRFALKNQFPKVFHFTSVAKKTIDSLKTKEVSTIDKENLSFQNHDYKSYKNIQLESELANRLEKNIQALNLCDNVIGVSQDVKNILTKYGVNPDKIIVQHIGSSIAKSSIQHTKKIDKNRIVFGFIGGVAYYKGVHQLVEAYINMPEDYKLRVILDIYGGYSEGYVKAITEDIIKNDKFSENIVFHGRYNHSDIEEISNKIDISVLPSLCADTAPQTIFESFSAGLPIIAPNIGGFPDFVIDNENGLLYEGASAIDLKNKMMYILDNPKQIERFAQNIKKSKTLDENIEELLSLYRSNKSK